MPKPSNHAKPGRPRLRPLNEVRIVCSVTPEDASIIDQTAHSDLRSRAFVASRFLRERCHAQRSQSAQVARNATGTPNVARSE